MNSQNTPVRWGNGVLQTRKGGPEIFRARLPSKSKFTYIDLPKGREKIWKVKFCSFLQLVPRQGTVFAPIWKTGWIILFCLCKAAFICHEVRS